MRKTLAILAVGALLPLCANDSVRFGARLSTEMPVRRMAKQAEQGVGLGTFATYDIGGGHAATVKLGFKAFDSKRLRELRVEAPSIFTHNCVTTANLGLDYSLHFNKTQTGLYGIVGIDAERKRFSEKRKSLNIRPGKTVISIIPSVHVYKNSIGYNLGVGYDISNKIGAQICYNLHNYNVHSSRVVNAAVTYSF